MTKDRTEAVRAALDIALRDFQHPTPAELTFEIATSLGDDLIWVHQPDGTSSGFWVDHPATGEALLVEVADFLQEQVFDQLEQTWGEARPPCPGHQHPADARLLDGEAWWTCPCSGVRLARIGSWG